MSWIETIDYDQADAPLKKIYDRVKGPDHNVDNVLMVHSLRPHTLIGHMTLYKNVLHHANNVLPKWYLEAIGVYVSYLNNCNYCTNHHYAGFTRLYNGVQRPEDFMQAVIHDHLNTFFDDRFFAGCVYARKLTLHQEEINKAAFLNLREAGFSDGEILEINQVTSYFNYVNRTVNGLGVTLEGDILGLSPNDNDDPNNWQHG
jgi:uncharacterized peroxidase-related enzyme